VSFPQKLTISFLHAGYRLAVNTRKYLNKVGVLCFAAMLSALLQFLQ